MRHRAFIALLMLLPVPSLGTAAGMFWWPDQGIGKIIFLLSKFWIVALPVLWLLCVEKGKLSWSPPRDGGFIPGILSGVVISLIIFLAYLGAVHFNAIDAATVADRAGKTGLDRPAIYIAGAAYWITLNSLMEEYVWRWFVFRQCETLVGGKMAVVTSALGFTVHHVIALGAQFHWPIALLASIGVFIGGAAWSWLYLRYRSVWPGYISHAIVDLAIFVIGYRLIFG